MAGNTHRGKTSNNGNPVITRTHDTLSATAFVAQSAERRTRFAGVVSSILTKGLGVAFFATGLG